MASELFQQRDPNTPWWYETPSLVSQTTHLTGFASSTESNPLDITPSVSSGYFEEDDGSNISEGSYGGRMAGGLGGGGSGGGLATTPYSSAPVIGTPYQRTESNWSTTSTIKDGQGNGGIPSAVNDFTGQTESTSTLVEGGVALEHPPRVPPHRRRPGGSAAIGETEEGGTRGVISERVSSHYHLEGGVVPEVAPVERLEGHAPPHAFNKDKDGHGSVQHSRESSESGDVFYPEEGAGGYHGEGNLLSHSMSAAHQDVLRYLLPQLAQNISPMDLLPYLKSCSLLSDDDIDYLYDPNHTHKDKVRHIVLSVPNKDMDAMETFVECLEMDVGHEGHTYLAKRFREALEKKRLYPFKRLSSLRSKSHSSSSTPPKPPPRTDSSTRHKIRTDSRSSMTMPSSSNRTGRAFPGEEEGLVEAGPKVPPKHHRKKKSSQQQVPSPSVTFQQFSFEPQGEMRMSQSMDPIPFQGDISFLNPNSKRSSRPPAYVPYAGNFSSLPRTPSQSSAIDASRGTKPYSSARYSVEPPMKQSPSHSHHKGEGQHGHRRITRHASFHAGMGGDRRMMVVVPMDGNPLTLSEDMDDDSYLYRKGSTGRGGAKGGAPRPSNHHGILSPISLPQPYVPPHRRKHDVILEDQPSDVGTSELEPNPRLPATFPRQVPSRSHSMHVHGEKDNFNSGNRMFVDGSLATGTMPTRETRGGSGLQRGGSLHAPRGDYYVSDAFNPLPGSSMAPSSIRDLQAEEEAEDKLGELVTPILRKHRRTRSYEPTNVPLPDGKVSNSESAPPSRRGVSEYFPTPSVLEESPENHTPNPASSGGGAEGGGAEGGGAGVVTVVGGAQDMSQQKMTKKKMQWLQQKVKVKEFVEEIKFDSLTHYHIPREIVYSGTLYEKGRARFVILLTDMLLILKPKKKKSGKFGGRGSSQHQFIDWFTDINCKTRTPFMLHHLSLEAKSRRAFSESFVLHYNKGSSLMKVTLHAVSKEAKDIWLDHLMESIRHCTTANAETAVPLRYSADNVPKENSLTKLTLTILEANNIAYSPELAMKNHYCVIRLGGDKCRTPSVKAKCWPTWNYQVNFSDFELKDILRIEFYTERTSCPDDFLGFVEINLQSATQKHQTKLGLTEMQLKKQHLPLKDGKGTLTVDFELKWDQAAQ